MSTNLTALVPLAQRPLHERVAAVIRAEMARFDITQVRLASALGVKQQTISSKKSGKTPFSLDELEIVAPLFGMTPEDVLRAARELRPVDPDGAGWAPWGSNPEPADYTSAQVIVGPWGACSSEQEVSA